MVLRLIREAGFTITDEPGTPGFEQFVARVAEKMRQEAERCDGGEGGSIT
jgi:hypothetical protein